MRKIIFLDIDGVLNSHIIASEWKARNSKNGGYGGWFKEGDPLSKEVIKWGHKNLENLQEIVDQTNAKIVISSTWRIHFSIETFKEMFTIYGWKDAPIIDRTPGGYKTRGLEINRWLKDHPEVESYVIIDDFDEFMISQKKNFVNTDPEIGLTYKDAINAINILNL